MRRALVAVSAGLALLVTIVPGSPVQAGVIGKVGPATPLTPARFKDAPPTQRQAWADYLALSRLRQDRDKASLAAELPVGQAAPTPLLEGKGGDGDKSMPLKRDGAWYGGAEARHVADVIVSFQTPAGGWGKNQSRSGAPRQPGQSYVAHWSYVGTLDNGATVTELRFLARVITATPGQAGAAYRASFSRGLDYLFEAQYPNGGWPQIWPLEGGYHDAVTYNDGALVAAARLLGAVAAGQGDYDFVSPGQRRKAARAQSRALDCILASQVKVGGRPTLWAQQYDAVTLQPAGARNFEPDALSSAESADILNYLMELPNPDAKVRSAVDGGVTWLRSAALHNVAWTPVEPTIGRRLVNQPGASPLWSRYYLADSAKPVFGDRDRTLHDDVNELSVERRNGYAWFNTAPVRVFARYAVWSTAH